MQVDVLIALGAILAINTIAFAWIWFTTPPKRAEKGAPSDAPGGRA